MPFFMVFTVDIAELVATSIHDQTILVLDTQSAAHLIAASKQSAPADTPQE
jgi:hypothetical protein